MLTLLYLNLFFIITSTALQSTIKDLYYIGAVVQYNPVNNKTHGQKATEENAYNFKKIIEIASSYNVDIIVFPEFGLTSLPNANEKIFSAQLYKRCNSTNDKDIILHRNKLADGSVNRSNEALYYRSYFYNIASHIPRPDDEITPCNTNSTYATSLKTISCAAKNNKMYTVVNHYELVNCTSSKNCSPDGYLLHNTNVVFNRQGQVIARYRKRNLCHEPWADEVQEAEEPSTFTTDFGVTFAQLIGIDLLKSNSEKFRMINPGVTDIVYSTHPFDDLPFLNPVQDQATWANNANVTLLVSSFNKDESVGLYTPSNHHNVYQYDLRRHSLNYSDNFLMWTSIEKTNTSNNQLVFKNTTNLKSHVHKKMLISHTFPDVFMDLRSFSSSPFLKMDQDFKDYIDINSFESTLLGQKNRLYNEQLCSNDVCCRFDIDVDFDQTIADKSDFVYYRYRYVTFSGDYKFSDNSTIKIELCAVISCVGEKVEDCFKKHPANASIIYPTNIKKIQITRTIVMADNTFIGVLTSRQNESLLSDEFNYYSQYNSTEYRMMCVECKNDIEVFGINCRRFSGANENFYEQKRLCYFLYPKEMYVFIAIVVIGIIIICTIVGYCISRGRKVNDTGIETNTEEESIPLGGRGTYRNTITLQSLDIE